MVQEEGKTKIEEFHHKEKEAAYRRDLREMTKEGYFYYFYPNKNTLVINALLASMADADN